MFGGYFRCVFRDFREPPFVSGFKSDEGAFDSLVAWMYVPLGTPPGGLSDSRD